MSAPYEVTHYDEIMENAMIEEIHNGCGKITNVGQKRLAKLEAHLNRVRQEYKDEKLAKALQLGCDRVLDYSNRVTAASGKTEARKVQKALAAQECKQEKNALAEGWTKVVKGKAVAQKQELSSQSLVRQLVDKEEQRKAFHAENDRQSALVLMEISVEEQTEAWKKLEQAKKDEALAKALAEEEEKQTSMADRIKQAQVSKKAPAIVVSEKPKPAAVPLSTSTKKIQSAPVIVEAPKKVPAIAEKAKVSTKKGGSSKKVKGETGVSKPTTTTTSLFSKLAGDPEHDRKMDMLRTRIFIKCSEVGVKGLTRSEQDIYFWTVWADLEEKQSFTAVVPKKQAPEPAWTTVAKGSSSKSKSKSTKYQPTSWGDSLCE